MVIKNPTICCTFESLTVVAISVSVDVRSYLPPSYRFYGESQLLFLKYLPKADQAFIGLEIPCGELSVKTKSPPGKAGQIR